MTEQRYPKSVRFKYAANCAYKLLRDLGNPSVPLNLSEIINHLGFIVDYGSLYGPHGYTLKIFANNMWNMVIRIATDIKGYDSETLTRMQSWTLAHEIGHACMHSKYMWDEPEKIKIPSEVESIFEVEAHWFASHLLLPNYIFKSIDDLYPESLMEKCNVNYTPALKRINNLDRRVRHGIIGDVPLQLARLARDFQDVDVSRSFICMFCGCSCLEKEVPEFCSICGNKDSFNPKGAGKSMIYDGVEMNHDLYPFKCPRCENEELNNHDHCNVCGVVLRNTCTNISYDFDGDVISECGQILDGKSRHCFKCGAESTYLQQELLRPWYEVKKTQDVREKVELFSR